VLTYPLAGNYGVPAPRPAGSIDAPYESSQIQVQGLVVQHAIGYPSHHASARTLGDWPTSEGIPAITGIDTRSLTRRLREHGTMRGWLVPGNGSVEQQRRSATGVEMQREPFHLVARSKSHLFSLRKCKIRSSAASTSRVGPRRIRQEIGAGHIASPTA
jgi:carbamoyl-phosphate synthase small subunit